MLSNLTGWHFLVILFIVLLLFGAPKLPALARSLGQSMKIFKSEIRTESTAADADTTDKNSPASPNSAPNLAASSTTASSSTAPSTTEPSTASADSAAPTDKPAS